MEQRCLLTAVLHKQCSASKVIKSTNAGVVLDFNGENEVLNICNNFSFAFQEFLSFSRGFDPSKVNIKEFQEYTSFSVTRILANKLNELFK